VGEHFLVVKIIKSKSKEKVIIANYLALKRAYHLIMTTLSVRNYACKEFSPTKGNEASAIFTLPTLKLNKQPVSVNLNEIVLLIEERDKQTFNTMGEALVPLVRVINGVVKESKPNALIELADHLTTFNTIKCYKYAYFAYREAVHHCKDIPEINEEMKWLLQDALLGIARILKGTHLTDEISTSISLGNEILQFLVVNFNNEEAESFL
jgi:hypothetical protein